MNILKKFINDFKEFFQKLSSAQKAIFLSGVALIFVTLIVIIILSGKENYSVLFSNLSYEDMNSIIEQLNTENVKYKLENNGTVIMVPKEQVYELRITMSAQGLPKAGGVGYEIFDRTNLGMTAQLEKIQERRALEGELIRTIEGIEGVRQARVHLVIPEDALFEEDQNPPTASIYLQLTSKNAVKPSQVDGITHLVSTSVEGLDPKNITVMDSYGNLLSEKTEDSYVGLSRTQLEITKKVETEYKKKIEDHIGSIVGRNKVNAAVTVDLDFSKVDKLEEKFDPKSTTPRSQELNKSESNVTGDSQEKSITNYEIDKTVTHIISAPGTISRLTASVFVDGVYTENNGEAEYQPRSEEELTAFESGVQTAIGYDPNRQDEISVQNVQFDRSEYLAIQKEMEQARRDEFIRTLIKYSALVIIILVVLFAAYIISKMLLPEQAEVSLEEELFNEEEQELLDTEAVLSEYKKAKQPTKEDKKHYAIIQELKGLSMENPKEIVQLLRTWMISEKD